MFTTRKKWFTLAIFFSVLVHFFPLSLILGWIKLLDTQPKPKNNPLVFELIPIQPKIIVKQKIKLKTKLKSIKEKKRPTIKKQKPISHTPLPKTSIQTDTIKDVRMQFWLNRMETIWLTHWSLQAQTLKEKEKTSGVIQATILKSGEITKLKILSKSKYSQIDETALQAIQRISQMPPIPPHYIKKYYILNFIYHYEP